MFFRSWGQPPYEQPSPQGRTQSLPGGLGGIQTHLHNDNPGFEHLQGARWGFSCDVSILESCIHIQIEIFGLVFDWFTSLSEILISIRKC